MALYDYDLVIIGGGASGLTAAKLARGLGKKVAVIEKNKLGGECTWSGCVPSKALIKAAEAVHYAKNLEKFGAHFQGGILDTSEVLSTVRDIIQNVYKTHTLEKIEQAGIDVLFGNPVFIDNHVIELGEKRIAAKKYVIATGSRPFVPPIKGLDSVDFLTNVSLFDLKVIPKSMVILGGGAIGVEMASAFNRLGTHVSIVEMRDRILQKDDMEISGLLSDHLKKEGIQIFTNTRAMEIIKYTGAVGVSCVNDAEIKHEVKGEKLLVSVGRRPNVDGLMLENAGVTVARRGIETDATLKTSADSIYACGDVVGPYLFSHMAWNQAIIATRNACIPFFKKNITYDHITWVTFSAPELAAAGMTETQARQEYGDTIKVYRQNYNEIDRGRIDQVVCGVGKFICNKQGKLLGAHILGPRAGELIHEVNLGKKYGISLAKFNHVVHAYPTYSELIWHAGKKAYVDQLLSSFGIKLLMKIFGKKRSSF